MIPDPFINILNSWTVGCNQAAKGLHAQGACVGASVVASRSMRKGTSNFLHGFMRHGLLDYTSVLCASRVQLTYRAITIVVAISFIPLSSFGGRSNSMLYRQLRSWVQVHIKTCKNWVSNFSARDRWCLSFLGAPCISLSLHGTHNHMSISTYQYGVKLKKVQMTFWLFFSPTWLNKQDITHG